MTRTDVFRISAPFIAMGGVWLVRRVVTAGYEATTGRDAPEAEDLHAPMVSVLVYAAGIAAGAAVVQALVTRQVAKASARQDAPLD